MTDYEAFRTLSPTTLADVLTREQVMDVGIRPLWEPMPRIAGPAFPVRCAPGDNLMLHAAIYRAPAGSVIVVEAGDSDYAVAGGNVCAVAQRRGIVAFVVDGVIRDLAESRSNRFPVFARGVSPIPGSKEVSVALVEATIAQFGQLDLLVNNAGATVRGDFLALSQEEWRDGFALKFFGAMRCCRAAWPHLQRSKGAIVLAARLMERSHSSTTPTLVQRFSNAGRVSFRYRLRCAPKPANEHSAKVAHSFNRYGMCLLSEHKRGGVWHRSSSASHGWIVV